MKKVLVTGSAGFIGKALLRQLLKKDIHVYAACMGKHRLAEFEKFDNITIFECNMSDYSNIDNILSEELDAVYHFAWDGTFGEKLKDYERQITNIKYSCDLMTALSRLGCKRFIFAGTVNQLEALAAIKDETRRTRKAGIYATSKLSCETYLRILANEYNIKFNMMLLSSIFGPGDYSYMINNVLIKMLMNGENPKLVEGKGKYDWLYIEDAAYMISNVMSSENDFKTYYIGNKKLSTLKDIVIDVRDILTPSTELVFGTIKGEALLDYSLINIQAYYEDFDDFEKTDFKTAILNTAEWIKQENI